MRVLIAGATGHRPTADPMLETGLSYGFRAGPFAGIVACVSQLGAERVTADVLDAASIKAAIDQKRPDAAINELTSLPRHYCRALHSGTRRVTVSPVSAPLSLLMRRQRWPPVRAATPSSKPQRPHPGIDLVALRYGFF